MSQPVMEFSIEDFQQLSIDSITLIGRCYQGPINVGERFHCLYELVPQLTENGYSYSKRSQQEHSVNLRIDSISSYGHSLTQLDPGMTAKLELSGEGIEKVKRRWILGTK
jgi:hypothetical protein